MMPLLNKNAVITGGSKGIGKSVSLSLANAGAKVFILDIDEINGSNTVKQILNQKEKASFYKIDVSQEKEWDKFSKKLENENESIDILVNNAGIWLGKEINDVSMEEYQRLISINLTGVFLGIKYLTPFLIDAGKKSKYGSSIINLSSVAGLVGSQLDPLYSMTKGGITTFTKSMAIYFGKKKLPIRINQVHPGIIETEMGDQVSDARLKQNPNMTSEDSYLAGISQTPIGRLGTAEEVAKTILFLSSDESSFMTGSSLVVDGGLTAQ
ncbi:MAG: SDR family oxidoreductase [Proteobacteria bacterium]|jgi:3(or 17)beta-hydroxysteroid dehydrogenase|nr:SDR family oxidoreductase [Pseudomonadota bacterium]MDA1135629.1 SDR family oxidoreductase [Pseudomonadota bacterium]|tara:strand:+ start:369 stop:1172 length:804 start_codon:yes stop_codon:yes gene_type:complete